MSSKLNWLIKEFPAGSVVTQSWLSENGISHSLTQKYLQSGWLKRLANGIFYRPLKNNDALPHWSGALEALTTQTDLNLHLAGLSSLQYKGLSQYLSLADDQLQDSNQRVWVAVQHKSKLPKWFKSYPGVEWIYCKQISLKNESIRRTNFVQPQEVNRLDIDASSPELASYELVSEIGKNISFEHAAEIFQGLVNLSPRKVQTVLSASHSVQTNRVFLFLCVYYNHQWMKRLDISAIFVGTGKRQVVENGAFDPRFNITVPKAFMQPQQK